MAEESRTFCERLYVRNKTIQLFLSRRFFRFHTLATSIYRKRAHEKSTSSTKGGAEKNSSKSVKKRLVEVPRRRATGEQVGEGLKNG